MVKDAKQETMIDESEESQQQIIEESMEISKIL
jgi:hypothetical protein